MFCLSHRGSEFNLKFKAPLLLVSKDPLKNEAFTQKNLK
jgi:hypothetical protein